MIAALIARPSMSRAFYFAAVAALLTMIALQLRPIWDDGWLELILREQGPDALSETLRDRPVMGATFEWLARRGIIWEATALLHFLTWWLLAMSTAYVWRRLCPGLAEFDVVPGTLALAPVVVQTQFILPNAVIASAMSASLAWTAFVLLDRSPITLLRGMVSAALAIAAILFTEYGFASVVAFAPWLLWSRRGSRSDALRIAGFLVLAIAAFAVYLAIADAGARQNVRPEHAVQNLGATAWNTPIYVVAGTWQRTFAALASGVGSVRLSRVYQVAGGILLAAAALVVIRRSRRADTFRVPGAALTAVAIGALGALAMPALMGRYADDGVPSRYVLPALPILAVVTVAPLFYAIRPQLRRVACALIVFVCGFVVLDTAKGLRAERSFLLAAGSLLQQTEGAPYRATGVIVVLPPRPLYDHRDYELTALLSRGLPDAQARLLWAWDRSSSHLPSQHDCASPLEVRQQTRLLARDMRLERLMQLSADRHGRPALTPLCSW